MFKDKALKVLKGLKKVINSLSKYHNKVVLLVMVVCLGYHIAFIYGVAVNPWDLMIGYWLISVELVIRIFDDAYKKALNTA